MRARVYLVCQVFHKKVKEERIGVNVKLSDSLYEGVIHKRVECVPVSKN